MGYPSPQSAPPQTPFTSFLPPPDKSATSKALISPCPEPHYHAGATSSQGMGPMALAPFAQHDALMRQVAQAPHCPLRGTEP